MLKTTNRRSFLKSAGVTAAGFWVAGGVSARAGESPNERLGMASIGIGGKGQSDSQDAANHGDMVAICDVDKNRLSGALKRFPKAKGYTDFRKMLEEMGRSIDAVTVSTPDHMHAPAALMAMRMGIHCFCQKPLTRTIYEARLVGQVAREKKLATQMGNQGTASDTLRRSAHWLKNGAIGKVRELHIWTDRAKGWWPQGIDRPAPSEPPEHLPWDLWLGVAPERPYADGYHPFKWRGWWDFGTGAARGYRLPFGEHAVHGARFAESDLGGGGDLGAQQGQLPRVVDHHLRVCRDRCPAGSETRLVRRRQTPAQGTPSRARAVAQGRFSRSARREFSSTTNSSTAANRSTWRSPARRAISRSGSGAIKTGEPAMSNFPDYAGPLTEAMLVGNLSVWCGQKVEWDAANMKVKNVPGLESLIKPVYRKGYTLDA